jgi:hypothetical protein
MIKYGLGVSKTHVVLNRIITVLVTFGTKSSDSQSVENNAV